MAQRNGTGNGNGNSPDDPSDIGGRGWVAVLKRTAKEFQEDNLTDRAAALTYYAVLALFPALAALVSIVGLLGQSTANSLLANVNSIQMPKEAHSIINGTIKNLTSHPSAAGFAFVIGLVIALWSASGYVGAFIRASNEIYEIREGRKFYKLRPLQMGVTLVMLILVAVCAAAIVVTGPITQKVGQAVGLGNTAQTVFDIVKWPVIVVIVSFMFSLLYFASPNIKQPGFRWITPGGVVAVVLWIIASVAFVLYTQHFPNNKTYGTFGGVIFFLMWLWISNIAVLFGQELNAELERQRELDAGLPAHEEIQLPPRAAPKEG